MTFCTEGLLQKSCTAPEAAPTLISESDPEVKHLKLISWVKADLFLGLIGAFGSKNALRSSTIPLEALYPGNSSEGALSEILT